MKTKKTIENVKANLLTNLEKTFNLIELHQGLKFSLYKKLHPDKSDDQLVEMISQDRLKRKHA
ncbi:MAG: hypothetical protein GY757_46445 [bacterium]|nr:hypothetical protein [bacterium]